MQLGQQNVEKKNYIPYLLAIICNDGKLNSRMIGLLYRSNGEDMAR